MIIVWLVLVILLPLLFLFIGAMPSSTGLAGRSPGIASWMMACWSRATSDMVTAASAIGVAAAYVAHEHKQALVRNRE